MLTVYRQVARVAHRLPLLRGRARESVAGRRGAAARWAAWAAERQTAGPLVWVHAASVGEALMAVPVIERLRVARPGIQTVLSHTSPSLAAWPGALPVEHCDYLPLDEPGPVRRVLRAVRPALVLAARGDLWPEFITRAVADGVPVAVAGATVRPESPRLRWPVRHGLRRMHDGLTWLGAVDEGHAARWAALGVREDRISVTGDPRHDAVLERPVDLAAGRRLRAWARGAPVLLAGSVEPGDLGPLREAWRVVRDAVPAARLVAVPHDLAEVPGVVRALDGAGAGAAVWDGRGAPAGSEMLVVDALGLLADLYAAAAVAWVGGGRDSRGVHAVIEPAAWAVPIVTGDARRDLTERVAGWLADPDGRRGAGLAARAALAPGAAGRTSAALLGHMR